MNAIPTWNGFAEPEVGATNLAVPTGSGILLTFSPGNNNKAALGVLAPVSHVNDPVDAILLSEIVDATTYQNWYQIYKDIDYSWFTQVGSASNVLKIFNGLTMCSLALTAPGGSGAPAGTELIIDAANACLKVRPGGDSTSPTIAVLLDAVLATAVQTGKVHMV